MSVTELEQQRLEGLEAKIEDWQRWILDTSAAGSIDPAITERMTATLDRLVELNGELREEDFDARTLAELRGLIIQLVGITADFDQTRAFEMLDDALVALEAMRHIVRDALDWHIHGVGTDPESVVASIYAALPQLRRSDVATLVGVSPRHMQRLARGEGEIPRQLELVARLIALLERGWSEQGVIAWFARPRVELDGLTPAEAVADRAYEERLLIAARQGRAQHGG